MKTCTIATAVFVLFTVGCVEIETPLSDPNTSQLDRNLFGTWVDKDGATYRIAAAGGDFPAGMHRLELTSDDGTNIGFFSVTQLGDQGYLNLVHLKDEPPKPSWEQNEVLFYTLAAYQVDKETAEFQTMNSKPFIAAVADGSLSSRQVIDDDTKYKVVTNDRKTLRDFIQQHGAKLISKTSIHLKRTK